MGVQHLMRPRTKSPHRLGVGVRLAGPSLVRAFPKNRGLYDGTLHHFALGGSMNGCRKIAVTEINYTAGQ